MVFLIQFFQRINYLRFPNKIKENPAEFGLTGMHQARRFHGNQLIAKVLLHRMMDSSIKLSHPFSLQSFKKHSHVFFQFRLVMNIWGK